MKPLTRYRLDIMIKTKTGPVIIIDAADIFPQFMYAHEERLTEATGRVFADTGAKTSANMKSFQEKIKQKIAVVVIPVAIRGIMRRYNL